MCRDTRPSQLDSAAITPSANRTAAWVQALTRAFRLPDPTQATRDSPDDQLGRPEILPRGGMTTGTHLRVSTCDLRPPPRIDEPINEPMTPAGMQAAPAAKGGAGL